MRLFIEIIGWILTAFGAYYVFEENTLIVHYVVLVIGVILLLISIPFKNIRGRKR
ncbi:hypothetical protein ACW2QC_04920 [Virgibacillus sp. FSP13]